MDIVNYSDIDIENVTETEPEARPEETVVKTTETENPVIVEPEETITPEEIQGEPAELSEIPAIEEAGEEDAEEPADTPTIEESVIPSYISHAQEIGDRENPIRANGGRETFIPSILQ